MASVHVKRGAAPVPAVIQVHAVIIKTVMAPRGADGDLVYCVGAVSHGVSVSGSVVVIADWRASVTRAGRFCTSRGGGGTSSWPGWLRRLEVPLKICWSGAMLMSLLKILCKKRTGAVLCSLTARRYPEVYISCALVGLLAGVGSSSARQQGAMARFLGW